MIAFPTISVAEQFYFFMISIVLYNSFEQSQFIYI